MPVLGLLVRHHRDHARANRSQGVNRRLGRSTVARARCTIAIMLRAYLVFVAACLGCQASGVTHESDTPARVQPIASPSSEPAALPEAHVTREPDPPACFSEPVEMDAPTFAPKAITPELGQKLNECATESERDECEFEVARTYFEANRFELAGPIFRRLAMGGQRGEAGYYAAMLLLECENVLGSHAVPPRQLCYEEMAADVPRLIARYCGGAPRENHEKDDLCPMLDRIRIDIARLRAEELVKRADRLELPSSASLYREAARGYAAIFEESCKLDGTGRNARGEVPRPEYRCDELIYNAFRCFRAARDTVDAEAARAELLDPKNKLTLSPLARRIAAE